MTTILPSCLLIFTFALQAHSHLTALRKCEYEDKEIPALLNWKGFAASKKNNQSYTWYWPKKAEDLFGNENDRAKQIENHKRIGHRSLDNLRFDPLTVNSVDMDNPINVESCRAVDAQIRKPVRQLGFLKSIPYIGDNISGIILQQENGNFVKSPFHFTIKETDPLTINYPNIKQANDKKMDSNDNKKYYKEDKEYYESSVDNQALLNKNKKKFPSTQEPISSDKIGWTSIPTTEKVSIRYELDGPLTERFNEKKVPQMNEIYACNTTSKSEITSAPTRSYEMQTPIVPNPIQNIFVLIVNYNDTCGRISTKQITENQLKPSGEEIKNNKNITTPSTTYRPTDSDDDGYVDATTPNSGETSTALLDETTCNSMKKMHNNPKIPQRKPSTKVPQKVVKYQVLNKPTQKSVVVPFLTKHILWNYPLNNNEISIEIPTNSTRKLNFPLILNHRKAKSTNLVSVRSGGMQHIPNEESYNLIQDLQNRLSIYSMPKSRKSENQRYSLRTKDLFSSKANFKNLEWKRIKHKLPFNSYKNSQIKAESKNLRKSVDDVSAGHDSLNKFLGTLPIDLNTQKSSAKLVNFEQRSKKNLDPNSSKYISENSISVDDLLNDHQYFSSESFAPVKSDESELGHFAYNGDNIRDDSAWTLEQEEQANYPQRVTKDLKMQPAPVQDAWEDLDKILQEDFLKRQSEEEHEDSEESKKGAISTLASYFHWLGSDH